MPFLLAGHRSSSNMSSLRQIFASIWFLAKTESSRQQQQQHLNDTSLRALKINRFKTTTNKSSAAASGSHTVAMKSFAAAAAKSSSRRKSRLGVSSDSLAVAVAVGFVIYILVLCSSLLTCASASRTRGGVPFLWDIPPPGVVVKHLQTWTSVCPRLCFKGSFRDENLCSKKKTSV